MGLCLHGLTPFKRSKIRHSFPPSLLSKKHFSKKKKKKKKNTRLIAIKFPNPPYQRKKSPHGPGDFSRPNKTRVSVLRGRNQRCEKFGERNGGGKNEDCGEGIEEREEKGERGRLGGNFLLSSNLFELVFYLFICSYTDMPPT